MERRCSAAPADVVTRSRAFIQADLSNIAQAAEKNFGIRNANQKIERFRALLQKWERLLPDNKPYDVNSLAQVYQREIFSKLDPKSHGM